MSDVRLLQGVPLCRLMSYTRGLGLPSTFESYEMLLADWCDVNLRAASLLQLSHQKKSALFEGYQATFNLFWANHDANYQRQYTQYCDRILRQVPVAVAAITRRRNACDAEAALTAQSFVQRPPAALEDAEDVWIID